MILSPIINSLSHLTPQKEQYGLSFLTLHSPPDDSSGTGDEEKTTPKTTPTKPKLGAFSLKEEPKALPTGKTTNLCPCFDQN